MFIGLNETVRGASHVDSDTVCQDYSSYKVSDHFAVAAVADGHGSKKHFRSDVGAKAAVEISIKAIEEFCADIDEFENKLREDPGHILTKIQKYIITHWYDAVNKHYNENEVKQEERKLLTDEELEGIKTESIYGTTIIVAVITDNLCFGLQLGDGSLVVIKQCGESNMPIIDDESCPANLTASLCNSNAIKMFNYFYDYDLPLSILVSTDGLFTSFSSKEDFEEYNCLLASQLDDIDILKERINKNFVRRTNSGSRDDISIAVIFEKGMFDENSRNVKMQVDINKNKAAIRDAEQKAKMLKRRARMEQIRRENEILKEKEQEERQEELRKQQLEAEENDVQDDDNQCDELLDQDSDEQQTDTVDTQPDTDTDSETEQNETDNL